MRAKWSAPIRKYWKISEQMMVKYCDLAICDSVNIVGSGPLRGEIERYISSRELYNIKLLGFKSGQELMARWRIDVKFQG